MACIWEISLKFEIKKSSEADLRHHSIKILHHSPASLISKAHLERKRNPFVTQLFISEGKILQWSGESCSSHIHKQKRAAQWTALSSTGPREHGTRIVTPLVCRKSSTVDLLVILVRDEKGTQVCLLPAELD